MLLRTKKQHPKNQLFFSSLSLPWFIYYILSSPYLCPIIWAHHSFSCCCFLKKTIELFRAWVFFVYTIALLFYIRNFSQKKSFSFSFFFPSFAASNQCYDDVVSTILFYIILSSKKKHIIIFIFSSSTWYYYYHNHHRLSYFIILICSSTIPSTILYFFYLGWYNIK